MSNKKEVISQANSKGSILDAFGSSYNSYPKSGIYQTREPRFSPSTSLTIIENDPTVKGAIIALVDKTLESGWHIEGRDKKSRRKDAEKKLKELRFNPALRKALFNAFLYNNAYIENVKSENSGVKDLNILETTKILIHSKDNGDIIDYYDSVNPSITWTPDQITHIKLNDFTTNVYADSDMKTLYETVLIKDYIRQWLSWFFGTNQMRPVFNSKTKMSPQKVTEFVSWMKACEKDLKKPFFFEGDVVVQSLMSFAKEGATIQQMLDWCDSQILQVLRMSPIEMGKPDQSGRSNSVEQKGSSNTRIVNVQAILEETFSYDLFPKIGFDKIDFKFNLGYDTIKSSMDTVQVMKNAMFSDEAITEFLESQGIIFETPNVFRDPVEEARKMQEVTMTNKDVGTGNEGSIGNKSADGAPSRQRQPQGQISEANKSSQKKEVTAQSSKFDSYPYVYEVKD
jgi:hypothetical protein